MVEWARVPSHTSRPNRKPRLWQEGIWLVNPVICFTSMEALARRLQGIVWGTFPVSYKLIIHSMLDEKMEKSKRYTWHLLHGIQGNVFLSSFSLFYDALCWGLTSCRSKKSGWCPAKIRQNLLNIYAETLASRFALLLEREGMMGKFYKSQSKVIDRRRNRR